MNKEKFGSFVSTLRKEQGLTQKELATKLYLTDKAISKWERGLSFPDISVLEPLADTLGVTVLELLQGERIEETQPISLELAQQMIDESITLSDQEINRKHAKSKTIILFCCIIVMFLVSFIINIRNLFSDILRTPSDEAATTQEDPVDREDAYAVTQNEEGDIVFINPKLALTALIEDYQENGFDESMLQYLHILENSLEYND